MKTESMRKILCIYFHIPILFSSHPLPPLFYSCLPSLLHHHNHQVLFFLYHIYRLLFTSSTANTASCFFFLHLLLLFLLQHPLRRQQYLHLQYFFPFLPPFLLPQRIACSLMNMIVNMTYNFRSCVFSA